MKKITLTLLLLLFIITPFFASALVSLTNSLEKTGVAAEIVTDANKVATNGIQTFVGKIINAFLGLLGTVFLVLLVYGGYLWMTAGGNEEDVTKAKKLIAQAVLGLAVVMGAYAISYFVTSKLENATGLT